MWERRFDLLGRAEVPGMRAEFRSFHRIAPFEETVLTPAHIFGLNIGGGAASLTRRAARHPGAFALEGPLTYRPRSTAWEVRSGGQPTLSLVCFLDDARLDDDRLVSDRCGVRDPDMTSVMLMIRQEIMAPGFASGALMESLREVLILKLLKRTRNARGGEAGESTLNRSELDRIRDYVWASRGKPPAVNQLAELCGMSPRTLLRRFRKSTGRSPSAYIAELQLAKSQWLLGTSQLSLKEIAFETGFATASQFSRAFKRLSGQTPGEFRGEADGPRRLAAPGKSLTDREHAMLSHPALPPR